MQREIKFRAWNKATKTMHYPDWDELAVRAKLAEIELMQYTGLKDKNGVESYWDDIVSDGINPPFVITPDYHLLARLSEIEFEVIGNIYEHSHLLDK